MPEEKPCPFCGTLAYVMPNGGYIKAEWWVKCPACRAFGPVADSLRDAIERWNAAPRLDGKDHNILPSSGDGGGQQDA